MLAMPEEDVSRGKGLRILKRKRPTKAAGCDPEVFADEVRGYLARARAALEDTAARKAAEKRHAAREAAKLAAKKPVEKRAKRAKVVDPADATPAEPFAVPEPAGEPFVGLSAATSSTLIAIAEALVQPSPTVAAGFVCVGLPALSAEAIASIAASFAVSKELSRRPSFFGMAVASTESLARIGEAMLPPPKTLEPPCGFFGAAVLASRQLDAIGSAIVAGSLAASRYLRGTCTGLATLPQSATALLVDSLLAQRAIYVTGAFLGAAALDTAALERIGASLLGPRLAAVEPEQPVAFIGLCALPAEARIGTDAALGFELNRRSRDEEAALPFMGLTAMSPELTMQKSLGVTRSTGIDQNMHTIVID